MLVAIIFAFIFLGCLLTWYLLAHDHGRKLPIGSLWVAFGFGVIAIVVAPYLNALVVPDDLVKMAHNYSITQKFWFSMWVGFVEESIKFIPLALFIYKVPYFRERTDGVIYFAICGLGFGLLENVTYTLFMGAEVGVGRLILTPFFHAASTSILGYYLVSAKIDHRQMKKFAAACFVVPLMHGLYDFFLFSGVPTLSVFAYMTTALLSLGLFLYFAHANDLDKLAIARVAAQSDHYCTECGKANVRHASFCESCGRHL